MDKGDAIPKKNMSKLTYLLIILVVQLTACSTRNSSTSIPRVEPDNIEKLKIEKDVLDTLIRKKIDKSVSFVKFNEKDDAIQIKADTIPENAITSYSLLKDSLGKILAITEFPISESGDWFIAMTHYFDINGKTFAFERHTGFFNSICTEGIAYETKVEFYNINFKLIDKTYELVDEKSKPLKKDSCTFPYDYKYKVSTNVDEYMKSNRLKTSM